MLGVGDTLPEFKVTGVKPRFMEPEENGQSAFEDITRDSFEGKWKVIYFYPKADTPGCTTQSCEVRDARGGLAKRGVDVIGLERPHHGRGAVGLDRQRRSRGRARRRSAG